VITGSAAIMTAVFLASAEPTSSRCASSALG